MLIIYRCEICGFESQDRQEVLNCEETGNPDGVSVGAKVEFRVNKYTFANPCAIGVPPEFTEGEWTSGTVTEISTEHKQVHRVKYYRVDCDVKRDGQEMKAIVRPGKIRLAQQ